MKNALGKTTEDEGYSNKEPAKDDTLSAAEVLHPSSQKQQACK